MSYLATSKLIHRTVGVIFGWDLKQRRKCLLIFIYRGPDLLGNLRDRNLNVMRRKRGSNTYVLVDK